MRPIAPYAYDYDLNVVSLNVTTPPAGAIDPREIGVRPTGAYWGAAGEQIDMRSGNLNYTTPILKAMGRGGWGVGFNLTYNSQNWRQDPAGTWQLGEDVGYGYGWKLLAGSLLPVYGDAVLLNGYLFTDSTGAQYYLNQYNNAGVRLELAAKHLRQLRYGFQQAAFQRRQLLGDGRHFGGKRMGCRDNVPDAHGGQQRQRSHHHLQRGCRRHLGQLQLAHQHH
jgi:hypothetical protein